MNDRDFDQILDAFLDLGPESAPDRVGAAARHEARGTRQTMLPAWWPSWRFPIMNSTVRYGIAAVAVIAVALVGINFLAPGNVGSPGSSALPTSEASRTPVPTVSPTAACVEVDPGATYLPVDRYCVDVGTASPVEITFDIANIGWRPYVPTSDFATLLNGDGWGLSFIEIENLYAHPCQDDDGLLDPPIGPAPDDLLSALGKQPAYEMTDPEEVTVGGYPGLQVDISVSDKDAGCTAEGGWGVAPSGFGTAGSMNPESGRPVRLWVGDVDGTRLLMVRPLSPVTDQRAADLLEMEAIVESLRFND